ncbi:MAG: hypothetical protein GWN71_31290, partial [Gammaproteobacteria bacterium]|nr:hypothetical protein [Gammaproteobacteria bacterium]
MRGLLALCELGLGPVLCRPMFQPIRPLPPFPFRPSPLPDLPNPFLPAPLPPGCGPFFDPSCGEPITEPSDPPPPGSGFGRRDFVWVDGVWIPNDLPEDGPPIVTLPIEFVSEMAMVSWNALMALVALSRVDGEPGTEDFDRENPFRTDGCSFANPGLCSNVRDIGALRTDGWRFDTLPDDPRRTGTLWLHEASIAYEVVRARGHLAG